VRFSLPRLGELIALLGAGCVIAALALHWYQTPEGNLSAWATFGPAVVLLMLAALAALALVVATVTERSTAVPVGATLLSVVLGLIAVVAAVVRLLERPHHASALCGGAWLAFAGALLILVGSWQAMRDERTGRYPPASPKPRDPPA
jgi:prepilin signal peptidase PulO-like enzyme (type II secretory pathway)